MWPVPVLPFSSRLLLFLLLDEEVSLTVLYVLELYRCKHLYKRQV